jgi:hypothetical protein
VLRRGGVVGIVAWGQPQPSEAGRVWNDLLSELSRPVETAMIANHALLDAPEKLEELLRRAGLERPRGWRRRFERERGRDEWLAAQLAGAERRLAGLAAGERAAFLGRVRSGAAALPAEAFAYRSEAIFALGHAPERRSDGSGWG